MKSQDMVLLLVRNVILDRISKIRQGQESIADFSYIGRSYRMLSQQFGNGNTINYLYDQGRRLTSKETKNRNQGLINKYVYGYNRVGMKMFEQRGHDGNKGDAFAYDEVYRLTGVKFNSPEPANPATALFEKHWASQLDKVDNILKIVLQTADGATEITTTIEGVNAQLNQYTRFDEWGLSYDLNGNTTQRGTQHITYDYRNRIVSVQGLGTAVKYNYDPFNRRVEKILGSGTVKYLYDGDQVIEERDGNDNILRQYVWGNGVDELIAIYVKDGDTFKAYYPHTNGSGSITAITNDQGEVIERVTYDVYGMPTFLDANNQPLANNQSTIGNNYLFQGREYDKETNLYYYRARYYDPIMGRFLQTDPMGYSDSMNLYQAFNMNGINFLDPFGLEKVIIADFQAVGGPRQSQGTGSYDQTPTKAGNFIIGTRPFVYSNPNARYVYSTIPWKTPIRIDQNGEVQYNKGNKWITLKSRRGISYTDEEIQDDVNSVLKEIRKNQPTQNIPSSIVFPDKWILNDYGHSTVGYFYDANNNGIMDNGEQLENDMIHPTPIGEMQKALGIPNNQIYLEKSHGCIHVTPDDIDTMIANGYLGKGTKVVVHIYSEDIPKGWKKDPNGKFPYEIHFFPGKKKMVILGEK